MLKKIETKNKIKIIEKINTYIAFLINVEKTNFKNSENVAFINKLLKNEINIDVLDIYVENKKDFVYKKIYFICQNTLKDLAVFKLPNIF